MTDYPLKSHEKQILKVMLENPYRQSTRKIAHKANISWNTADKYLNQFKAKNWVKNETKGRKKAKDLWFPLL